jgi:hypothetical protein
VFLSGAFLVSAPTGMAVAKPLQDPTRHHLLTNEEEAAVPRTNEIKAFRANEEVAIHEAEVFVSVLSALGQDQIKPFVIRPDFPCLEQEHRVHSTGNDC